MKHKRKNLLIEKQILVSLQKHLESVFASTIGKVAQQKLITIQILQVKVVTEKTAKTN